MLPVGALAVNKRFEDLRGVPKKIYFIMALNNG